MITLNGKTVCGGAALGRAMVYRREESIITRYHIESSDAEIERFERARHQAINELASLYADALSDVGDANAEIFGIHIEMLNDPDYIESVKNIITDQLLNAETAVGYTCDSFVQMFESLNSVYIRGRNTDIKDVSERVIRILEGKPSQPLNINSPVILIAEEFTPSEIVQFDRSKILALVAEKGSVNSHTAILARMMNIPSVIGVSGVIESVSDGAETAVDAVSGTVYISPDETTLDLIRKKRAEYSERMKSLRYLKGKESVTEDGKSIALLANIGNAFDTGDAIANDAEGVGLFRSESLYLESYDFPSEESQFNAYKKVLEDMAGKRVIIRTLDLGADKQPGYFRMDGEDNPALGIRAVRLCLERKDLFRTQLRALYRASAYGQLSIMFPMITSEWEIDAVMNIIRKVKSELDAEGVKYSRDVDIGCMIETPSAAIIADKLAERLDFFSIGTNDLTQYALAADRTNPHIGKYFDPRHKSVLRLIYHVTETAHAHGIPVGICGEIAADLDLTETFLALDLDSLSVPPAMILAIRDKVRGINVSEVKDKILEDILN